MPEIPMPESPMPEIGAPEVGAPEVEDPEIASATVPSPGRPLDPEISRAILDATLELLVTEGYAGVGFAAVAARAGVHKPAVYRRWPHKLDLAIAAVEQWAAPPRDPSTGDTMRDLVELLTESTHRRGEPFPFVLILRLRAEITIDPELSSAVDEHIVAPRRAIARAVIERGIERGDLRPEIDPEIVTDLIFGTLWARLSSGREAPGPAEAQAIVATMVDGLRAPGR